MGVPDAEIGTPKKQISYMSHEVRQHVSSNFAFLFQDCFGYSYPLQLFALRWQRFLKGLMPTSFRFLQREKESSQSLRPSILICFLFLMTWKKQIRKQRILWNKRFLDSKCMQIEYAKTSVR